MQLVLTEPWPMASSELAPKAKPSAERETVEEWNMGYGEDPGEKGCEYTGAPPCLLCNYRRITSFSNFSAFSPSGVVTFRRYT